MAMPIQVPLAMLLTSRKPLPVTKTAPSIDTAAAMSSIKPIDLSKNFFFIDISPL